MSARPRREDVRARYEAAAERHRSDGDRRRLAHALRHLAEIHTENRRLELADECLSEALGIYEPMADLPALELANTVRPLALLREAQGRRDEAMTAWREARALYERSGVQAGVDECDAHLADGPESEGRVGP